MSQNLDRLFNPSSVALIGASKDEEKSGGMFLKSLIDHRFRGALYPVNPKASEIMGLKSYPSVLEVPGEIDLAIMTIPAQLVPQAMEQCAQKGVRFVVVHSAGFSDIGGEGTGLQAQIMEMARKGGVRVVGPNCMGVHSPGVGLDTVVAHVGVPCEAGSVAFVGQSGWACESFITTGYDRGLRLSKVVSSGNQADLDTVDYLRYFGADPQTKVIGAHVEGVREGRELLEVAREIAKQKPVIIWKVGKTEAGTRAVVSHTGTLAGSYHVYDGAFRQAGIIKAEHFDELLDFAIAFVSPWLPSGNRLGVLVDAGGGAVAAADVCGGFGLELPQFPEEIQQELKELLTGVLPPFSGITNPVDLVWAPNREIHRVATGCLEIMSKVVDAFLLFTYHPIFGRLASLSDETFASELRKVSDRTRKPILLVPPYPTRETQCLSIYTQKGIPAFPSIERAAKAMSVLVEYFQYLRESHEE